MFYKIDDFQNSLLNSIVYEGKSLNEWINYFKVNYLDSANVFSIYMEKTSEAYYLFSKIKPYVEFLEKDLDKEYSEVKDNIISSYSTEQNKRLPNLEILDNLTKVKLKEKYEKYNISKMILSTFEIIVRQYESLSYVVNKKYG